MTGWHLLVVWAALSALQTAAALPACKLQLLNGQAALTADCSWQGLVVPSGSKLVLEGKRSIGRLPILDLQTAAELPAAAEDGYSLSIKRLLLDNVTVGPPAGKSGVPAMLPLGLFAAAPSNLTLMDVRLVASQQDFATYQEFFSKQLDPSKLTADGGSITLQTDNKTFLHIPSWSDSHTQLYAVTLVTGPCRVAYGVGHTAAEWKPRQGCNILSATNATLVPVLLSNASVRTPEPLLIRITTNVSLGAGLNGSIPIRRPIILLGLSSALTSVDLGMVVNQLNVTAPTATLLWQSLVLENLAPGDTLSSLIAPPYSTTTSTNMWSIHCNRSAALCVRMNNVTMVIPSEREVNYHLFMYTMYGSPAPSLRQLAQFMHTDLGFKQLEFSAGPGNDTMTIKRLLSRSWQFKNVVTTAQTFVAPQLPVPPRPFVLTKSGPAPLVQAIQDCASFNAAINYNSSRVFVWRLLHNVSIAENGRCTCDLAPGYIAAPTHLFGQVLAGPKQPAAAAEASAAGTVGDLEAFTGAPSPAPAAAAQPSTSPPGSGLYSLSFGFVPSVFELPADAQDKFMQIQNVTLSQLPQQLQQEAGDGKGASRIGRLLRQMPSSEATPPGVWSILLWAFRRGSGGSPLYIADSQLMLPEPEWTLLFNTARGDDSFAMQLQGPVGLALTGVTVLESWPAIRVGSLQGPGITGSNLWLLRDPTPVAAIPGYTWPASLAAAGPQSEAIGSSYGRSASRLSAGVQAAIGISVAVATMLAVVLGALLLRRWRASKQRRAGPDMLPKSQPASPSVRAPFPGELGPDTCSHHTSRASRGKPSSLLAVSGGDCTQLSDRSSKPNSPVHSPGRLGSTPAAAAVVATGIAVHSKTGAGLEDRVIARGSSNSSGTTSARKSSKEAEGSGLDGQSGGSASTASTTVERSIAAGLERWSAAVSATTMQLMKRRLQVNHQTLRFPNSSSSCGSGSSHLPADYGGQSDTAIDRCAPGKGSSSDSAPGLQLQRLLGTGSFGSVYLGLWRGKQVAVKVMHLPADALDTLMNSGQHLEQHGDGGQDGSEHEGAAEDDARCCSPGQTTVEESQHSRQRQRLRRQWQVQQNSPPHMAMMESVLSSTMCHPNVVQVYTYMLTPLMAHDEIKQQQHRHKGDKQWCSSSVLEEQQDAAGTGMPAGASGAQGAQGDAGRVSGWQLRIILEYCEQGTLREALDRKRLPHLPGTTFLEPLVVLSLCHDVAAALLHLHSEGIVHGDLKAGNVLLTAGHINTANSNSSSRLPCICGAPQDSTTEVWTAASCLPLTAKCADFGLAQPLGPTDTHATMLARGTPTHMAPELLTAGHVSRASDVYAFGILLFEVITGRRAYAGVPVALLPHEVAVQGRRPEWPEGLPPQCRQLQQLAEACWAQYPYSRPTFVDILQALEQCCMHNPAPSQAGGPCAAAGAASGFSASTPTASRQQAHLGEFPSTQAGGQQQQQQQLRQQQVRVPVQQDLQQSSFMSPSAWPAARPATPTAAAGLPAAGPAGVAADAGQAGNRNRMSWSEVSYGASSS